jgi:hypothetical protein
VFPVRYEMDFISQNTAFFIVNRRERTEVAMGFTD